MKFGQLDIPDEVLEAQQNGNLVVFAGAGVSKAPPANTPLFSELVNEIARGEPRRDNEDYPRFLSRLRDLGVPVHEKAHEIIARYDHAPSVLHESIVRLFSSDESVRIVTTNFDTLFSLAARQHFGEDAARNVAPQLPQEPDFTGVVYVHGNLSQQPSKLVLTEDDYAKAYDDPGWARGFLKLILQECVLLFIGYSHDDTPARLQTLALAQRISRGRFALTPETDTSFWKRMGISPIFYTPTDDHAALYDGLAKWADRTQMDYLDHDKRIKAIVSQSPPESGDDLDYINWALRNPTLVQFFTSHATAPEWLDFVEKGGLLSALFQIGLNADEVTRRLAWWLAHNFSCQHPSEVLGLVGRNGQRLNKAPLGCPCACSLEGPAPPQRRGLRFVGRRPDTGGLSGPGRLLAVCSLARLPTPR